LKELWLSTRNSGVAARTGGVQANAARVAMENVRRGIKPIPFDTDNSKWAMGVDATRAEQHGAVTLPTLARPRSG
jgi:hypothetical protein